MKKKVVAMLLVGVMASTAVACGLGADSDNTAPTESNAAEADADEEESEDIGDSLVLYCSMTDDDVETVVEGFNELYPDCEVEVVNGSAGELCARIQAESENPQGDVMLGGINQTDGDTYKDIFEPYLSKHEDEIYDEYKSNNGFYNYDHLSSVVFCVNTDLETELGLDIEDYDDLLDPALAGKVVISDPNESSAAWNNVSNIMAVYGYDSDESWDLIEGLMKNNMVIASSSSVCFKAVADGEYVVGLTYEDGASTLLKSGAENIKLVYPASGSSSLALGCAVVKNAPHMAAAKAMVDYLMDADSQTVRGNALGTIRLTNKNANIDYQYIPKTEDVKWVSRDIDWLIEHKQEVLDHWNQLYMENYQ